MKKLTQIQWVFISLGGFIFFALFLYLILTTKQKAELSPPLYFFLIVIIDLVATAFLAGAMKSVATYRSSSPKGNLYLAGPIVVFCVILYLGYQYRPMVEDSPLSLSVKLISPKGTSEQISSGAVNVTIELFQQTRNVNDIGIAFFTGIDHKYKGKPINLSLQLKDYHLPDDQVYALSDSSDHTNLFIKLIKNEELTSFQGRLISLSDQTGIANATIHFAGTKITTQTDSLGNFSSQLPVKSGTELRIIVLKGNKEVYNSLRSIYQDDYLTLTESQ